MTLVALFRSVAESVDNRVPASRADCLAACELECHGKALSRASCRLLTLRIHFFLLDIVLVGKRYLSPFLYLFKSFGSVNALTLY
jgi:hypothetical protein